MGPEAIVVTERRAEAPARRIVYEPRAAGGYERREQLWRAAKEGWHGRRRMAAWNWPGGADAASGLPGESGGGASAGSVNAVRERDVWRVGTRSSTSRRRVSSL